ncbi:MAG TPA: CPCC family cysteine-rich protein [Thermoanaerobaculia bacterium]
MTPFATRRAFFDDYPERHAIAPSLAAYGIRFTCPCCGFPTLKLRGLDGICFLCRWEDDGQDDQDAEAVRIGPNRQYSLARARINFDQFLVKYDPGDDRRITGPDTPGEIAEKKRILDAFEAMIAGASPDHEPYWKVVLTGERELG